MQANEGEKKKRKKTAYFYIKKILEKVDGTRDAYLEDPRDHICRYQLA